MPLKVGQGLWLLKFDCFNIALSRLKSWKRSRRDELERYQQKLIPLPHRSASSKDKLQARERKQTSVIHVDLSRANWKHRCSELDIHVDSSPYSTVYTLLIFNNKHDRFTHLCAMAEVSVRYWNSCSRPNYVNFDLVACAISFKDGFLDVRSDCSCALLMCLRDWISLVCGPHTAL